MPSSVHSTETTKFDQSVALSYGPALRPFAQPLVLSSDRSDPAPSWPTKWLKYL